MFGLWSMCARQLSPTDAAILRVLDGRPEFTPSAGAASEVLTLLDTVATVHRRALTARHAAVHTLAA